MPRIFFVLISVSLALSATLASAGTPQEERYKALTLEYLKTRETRNWREARKYLADDYVEQHPGAPKGAGVEYVEMYYKILAEELTAAQSVVLRIFAEDDLVAVHVRDIEEPGMKNTALIIFFRFNKDGKIAEHWDVYQHEPGALNLNGMF